jgi:selenide,water dikinase
MLPGFVSGHYAFGECHIDLDPLCNRANVTFHRTEALAIDPRRKTVTLGNGMTLPYDVLSVDIGSTPPARAVPGALEHAICVKPVSRFLEVWDEIRATAQHAGRAPHIAVIGGGAGGVELALALHHRLGRCCGTGSVAIDIFTDTPAILPGHAANVVRIVARILAERGITVHAGSKAIRIEPGTLHTSAGSRFAADYFIWATGAGAPAWIAASGIETDGGGFIAVNACLQSVSHANVFAAGDVASMVGHRLPKSGVYAVRQGPPLATNLRQVLASGRLTPYVPQRTALALISAGNRYAVASYGNVAFEGAWVWRWKDVIDRRFMRRYHEAALA